MRLVFKGKNRTTTYAAIRLVFKGTNQTTSQTSHVEQVNAGDEFEVPDAIGQKMLSDFGSSFEVIKPSLKKAPKTTVISSGDAVDTSILDGSVSALRDALESGSHDSVLYLLREAELGGKTRKGAIAAIEERRAEVDG